MIRMNLITLTSNPAVQAAAKEASAAIAQHGILGLADKLLDLFCERIALQIVELETKEKKNV